MLFDCKIILKNENLMQPHKNQAESFNLKGDNQEMAVKVLM